MFSAPNNLTVVAYQGRGASRPRVPHQVRGTPPACCVRHQHAQRELVAEKTLCRKAAVIFSSCSSLDKHKDPLPHIGQETIQDHCYKVNVVIYSQDNVPYLLADVQRLQVSTDAALEPKDYISRRERKVQKVQGTQILLSRQKKEGEKNTGDPDIE